MAADTPRRLYVAILAAALALAGIVAANSAQAQAQSQTLMRFPGGLTYSVDVPDAVPDAVPVVFGSGVPVLPDPAKTPGAFYPDDEATVCGKVNGLTYEKRSRAGLTQAMKNAITRSYGQTPGQDGDHELDHRGPAALAGRSDASNVWWQPGRNHGTVWDFHVKDRLDTWAWRQVCVLHKVPLATAQAWFVEPDWTKVYCREMGGPPCPP